MTNIHSVEYKLADNLPLGQTVEYEENYSPSLLKGIPRALGREKIGLHENIAFSGVDIWNSYEVSWLNGKGKPQVAIMRCWVDVSSENIVESKSFKLYLNSFNQSQFSSWQQVTEHLEADLSNTAKGKVTVKLYELAQFNSERLHQAPGECIDQLDVSISCYHPNPNYLNTSEHWVEETLCSDLLKSNCLITSQPDWASIVIRYQGKQIMREGLLKYIISFRQHNEFHEQCVERIFNDISTHCGPDKLTVYARYTRRGGLDINPFRSNFEEPYQDLRLPRQ